MPSRHPAALPHTPPAGDSSRRSGPGARTRLHPRLAAAMLAAAAATLVACGGGAGGRSTPSPARTPTPTPTPPTAARTPATRFAYGTAPTAYEVTADGTVTIDADTIAPLHVTTTTRMTLSLGAATDEPRPVQATVDAFVVPGARSATSAVRLPLALTGTLDTRRHRVALALAAPQAADTACLAAPPIPTPGVPPARPTPATPALSLLATARDLLPTPPTDLSAGTRWEEESETVECRGTIPVTTRTRYRFEVVGPATFAGITSTIRVTRTTESDSRGERTAGSRTVRVQGESRGTFDLYFNPVTGRYAGGTGQSEGTLEVDTGDGKPRRFTQRFTTRVGARGVAR